MRQNSSEVWAYAEDTDRSTKDSVSKVSKQEDDTWEPVNTSERVRQGNPDKNKKPLHYCRGSFSTAE